MNKQTLKTRAQLKQEFVKNVIRRLGLTPAEAEELWQYDNGFKASVEADELAAKAAKKTYERPKQSPIDKIKYMRAQKKADEEKERVIKGVFDFIGTAEFAIDPQQISSTKIAFQGTDGGWYTVTVTKNKNQPDGYMPHELIIDVPTVDTPA
jgi:hypothetical protein